MNETIERHRRLTVTSCGADGVTRTEVRVSERVSPLGGLESLGEGMPAADDVPCCNTGRRDSSRHETEECFDPSTCCSAREQRMIAALRAYLRPDQAPDCLTIRLRACLDPFCDRA